MRMVVVYKFGGSSLDSGRKIRKIVRQLKDKEIDIIVCSAIGKTTDMIKMALNGNEEDPFFVYEELKSEISFDSKSERKYHEILNQFFRALSVYRRVKSKLLESFLLVCGERIAVEFIKSALADAGFHVESIDFYDSRFPLIVEGPPLNASINLRMSRERAKKLDLKKKMIVFPGFAGIDLDGNVRILGRGGSDLAAMGYGYSFKAKEIWLCTDVDGVKSAPPRIIKDARTVKKLSIEEAMDAAFFGAKLPSTRTLEPLVCLYKEGLEPKCVIANSINLEGEKTEIVKKSNQKNMIIAGRDVVRFSIEKREISYIIEKLFDNNLDFFLVGTNRYFNLFIPEEFSNLIELGDGEGLYLAGVVSASMAEEKGISAEASTALNEAGINILYNVDPSRISIGFIISREDTTTCIEALYNTFMGK